jgi:amino acid transporter
MFKNKITLFALVMLVVGSIDSVRNLPSTAFFGPSLIFFFLVGALFFLIPGALIAADLAAANPDKSGVYQWVKRAFGPNMGFLAIWLQWVNTLVWFPTMLAFIAGTLAFFIHQSLGTNNIFLMCVIIGGFWLLTLLNLRGIDVSARFASICTLVGMIIPMGIIIVLAVMWISAGKPMQVSFSLQNLLPNFHTLDNWFSLTGVMTSFLGIELAAVHMMNIQDARKNYPKAMLISIVILLFTMIIGSLAIAIVLPQATIGLNQGVMQAFEVFLTNYHLHWFFPALVFLVLLGSLGEMINWMISPARGLFQAAEDHFLPAFLTARNKQGVPVAIALIQAVVMTIVSLAFIFMPSVNGSYWLLTALSTELYMLMYLFMFFAALRLESEKHPRVRLIGMMSWPFVPHILALMGILGCLVTLYIGFLPPSGIDVGTPLHYHVMFVGGLLLMIVPVIFFIIYRKLTYKGHDNA